MGDESRKLKKICEIFSIPYESLNDRRDVVKNFQLLKLKTNEIRKNDAKEISNQNEVIAALEQDIAKQKYNRQVIYDMYRAGAIAPSMEQFLEKLLKWNDASTAHLIAGLNDTEIER